MSSDFSDPRTFGWVEAGISGIPRTREWDAVTTVVSAAPGRECVFVRLQGGENVVESGSDELAERAALALEVELEPPFRAVAVRREGDTWAVGAVAIEVVELPADTEGEELMLTVTQGGERALEVDGRPTLDGLEALERVAGGRFETYVLRASRLEGRRWEVGIDPL